MTLTIGLIPARGGTKRLPRKNIIPFAGKPIIAWTIEAALKSEIFDVVAVTTDDDEIASVAEHYGASIYWRPEELGSDSATCASVCRYHLLDLISSGKSFERLFCMYPTAPLRTEYDILAINRLFEEHTNCVGVIAVTDFSHYPFQALQLLPDSRIKPYWPELCQLRASLLPPLVAGNGSTYAINVDEFMHTGDFYSATMEGFYAYRMDPLRSIDIDVESDLLLLNAAHSVLLELG